MFGVPEFVINDKPSIEGNENISKFESILDYAITDPAVSAAVTEAQIAEGRGK